MSITRLFWITGGIEQSSLQITRPCQITSAGMAHTKKKSSPKYWWSSPGHPKLQLTQQCKNTVPILCLFFGSIMKQVPVSPWTLTRSENLWSCTPIYHTSLDLSSAPCLATHVSHFFYPTVSQTYHLLISELIWTLPPAQKYSVTYIIILGLLPEKSSWTILPSIVLLLNRHFHLLDPKYD